MQERATLSTRALGLAAAGVAAISLSSCDTIKSAGKTAAKPFVAAGEAAKKVSPMRLLDKRKAKKDAAQDVTAELADVTASDAPTVAAGTTPTLNTLTPGAQPTPGTRPATRSTLSLPSSPNYDLNPRAPLPTRPVNPIATQPAPSLTPAPVTALDAPLRLDQPPALPPSKPEPLSTPPKLIDDGFIQLTPKLPGEEDPLLPE